MFGQGWASEVGQTLVGCGCVLVLLAAAIAALVTWLVMR